MSIKYAYVNLAVKRNFYINEVVPHISRIGRKVKKCIVVENGKEIYYSYSNERLTDSVVVNNCIDRFKDYLLAQNYQGEAIIYLNSQFVGFDTRGEGYLLGKLDKPPQIVLVLKYLDKQQIDLANEIIKSLMKGKKSVIA
jgi:hypothetical protein